MIFDLEDPNAWPFDLTISDLSDEEQFKAIEDPFPVPSIEESSDNAKKRDEAYEAISDLLDNHIVIQDKKKRNELISEQVKKYAKSRVYILRQLRKYWQRGLCANALAPNYNKCGGKGKTRRDIQNKPGAKRKFTAGDGVIVTDQIVDIFSFVLRHFYLPNERVNLKEAMTKVTDMYTSRFPTKADAFNRPTPRQFQYFYHKHHLKKDVIEARTPKIIYNKDIAPLRSTATVNQIGPGTRYEIDATIGDIYLVSEKNRERIIGRPVIYKIKDVFSRMIVGIYVGLENPSWATASIAIANAFSNKVDFCRKYGIEINSSLWPSEGLPFSIAADRGEMLGKQADMLEKHFKVKLKNTRAHRPNDKGIVERAFAEMHAKILHHSKGVVEAFNGKKRTGKRYELDAELSLRALTQMIIRNAINYNNYHVLTKYDRSEDMPTSLPSIPIHLWNWGLSNRIGEFREINNELIRINLLPQKNGDVSELGINFYGLKYTCSEAMQLGWFHRSKQIDRPNKVLISYDPRNTNLIYLRPNNDITVYWECFISDRSREYSDMTFQEMLKLTEELKVTNAVAGQEEGFNAANAQRENEETVKQERKKNASQPKTLTNNERLNDKGDARKTEKEYERQKARDAVKKENKESAEVIPFNKSQSTDESLAYRGPVDYSDYEDD